MNAAAGVGLAAPQVRVAERLFVYDVGEGPGAIINPELVRQEGQVVGVEGCLSIPRLQGEVVRAEIGDGGHLRRRRPDVARRD